jgi:8-amino-3,8-dideoxy-alpha-D-manno-octulosonate transaminase
MHWPSACRSLGCRSSNNAARVEAVVATAAIGRSIVALRLRDLQNRRHPKEANVAIDSQLRLARDGGTPARTGPERPMFPGGMEVGDEELAALARVIRSKNLFRYYGVGEGPQEVAAFEREFAQHLGAKRALAVNAGSSALICGLIGAGVGRGDEVIVPAYTWNATPNAVLATGALPVLAEVDESLTLDPAAVEAKLSSRTKAILPVHMRGNAADMAALVDLARRHGLALVEDACQAAGASFRGARLGTFGDAGAFSLQFNKIITTGEGGVLITSREDLYATAIEVHDCAGPVRDGGQPPHFPGWNFRASELTGAVARVQLGRLDGLLERMRAHHARLAAAVAGLPGLTLRRSNDPAGDAGLALIAYAESAALAADAADALRAEGVPAVQMYSPKVVDMHFYPFWRPVLAALAEAGRPAPECPRTLELVGRALHIDVPPQLGERDLEEVELALRKVALGVLG